MPAYSPGRLDHTMLFKSPSCWTTAPSIPVVEDMVSGRVICQHSSTEAPLTAEMAVRLNAVIGVTALGVLLPWLQAATNRDDDSIVSSDLRSMVRYI